MKITSLALLLLTLLAPVSASALQAEDLVAIAAMPLAVAAVSEITDVPTSELMNLVATMNQAQVPAPQFIEVVRYAPVALVDTSEPFVPYITSQVESGVRGEELAVVIEDRIERYDGADTIDVASAPRVVVVDDDFLPPVVVTRFQTVSYDPLALVAMPLAVAAASEITGVPAQELASLVSLLNQGAVPPRQFVEIVRYSPVALIDSDPAFLTYVTTQLGDGSRGITLARLIEERYEVLGVDDVHIINPPPLQLVSGSEVFIPPVVTTRITEARNHPHGGPPGQLKKDLGLQTGAEVVHGAHPGGGKTRVAKAERAGGGRGRVAKGERSRSERVASSRGRGNGGGKARVERSPRSERRVDRAPRVKQQDVTSSRGSSGGGNPAKGGKGNSGNGNGKGKGKG